jgi:hypothetical protein
MKSFSSRRPQEPKAAAKIASFSACEILIKYEIMEIWK